MSADLSGENMNQEIAIVDRGRGLQLSTSRITVQDLVPYFQEGAGDDDIRRWIPSLTPEEISVVREYYSTHKEELDEQDRRIREWTEEQVRQIVDEAIAAQFPSLLAAALSDPPGFTLPEARDQLAKAVEDIKRIAEL